MDNELLAAAYCAILLAFVAASSPYHPAADETNTGTSLDIHQSMHHQHRGRLHLVALAQVSGARHRDWQTAAHDSIVSRFRHDLKSGTPLAAMERSMIEWTRS